jgi:DNA-binding NtrC family response regulator
MERAVIFCDGDTLNREHLPKQYKEIHGGYLPREMETARNALEKEMILKALSETGGRRQEAAEKLKMHRKTLYNKMKRLGIE